MEQFLSIILIVVGINILFRIWYSQIKDDEEYDNTVIEEIGLTPKQLREEKYP